jgi:hypothetical protein
MAVQDNTWTRTSLWTLSTLDDARRASITGTTLNGPNGSGQFYWMYTSTVTGANLQARLGSSNITPSSVAQTIGILQNTPGPGEACDICWAGYSKVIAGTTSIVVGTLLQGSSAPTGQGGEVVGFNFGNGPAIGWAAEAPTSTGALFTAYINVTGARASTNV